MQQPRGREWRQHADRIVLAFAVVVILGLAAWCVWCDRSGVPELYSAGDVALTELYTVHASRGPWGLGPYSRFGWHHPGPIYFYWLAPFYRASGQHGLGLEAGALAINLLAALALARTLWRHASASVTMAVLSALAIFVARVPAVLMSSWNPHVLVLPFATLVIVTGVIAAGRLSLLPVAVLLASFIAQTHVGLAPSALLLLALATAIFLVRHGRSHVVSDITVADIAVTGIAVTGIAVNGIAASARPPSSIAADDDPVRVRRAKVWLLASVGVAILCWAPVLHHELTAPTSNVAAMVRFFATTHGARLAFGESARAWTQILIAPFTPGFTLAVGHVVVASASLWMIALVIGALLLLAIAARWSAKNGRTIDAWICCWCVLATLLALISIAGLRGGLMDHLIFWIAILGALDAGVLVGMGVAWIASMRRAAAAVPRAPALAAVAACVTLGLIATLGVAGLMRDRAALLQDARAGLRPVGRLYQTTRQAIAKSQLRRPLIEVRVAWEDAASIMLQLHKHHVPFGVERGSAWMFGAPIAARGDEDGAITIANHEVSRELREDPRDCVVALTNETVVHFRFTAPAQRDRLDCLISD